MLFTFCSFPDLAAWDRGCLMVALARGDYLAPLEYGISDKRAEQKAIRLLRCIGQIGPRNELIHVD